MKLINHTWGDDSHYENGLYDDFLRWFFFKKAFWCIDGLILDSELVWGATDCILVAHTANVHITNITTVKSCQFTRESQVRSWCVLQIYAVSSLKSGCPVFKSLYLWTCKFDMELKKKPKGALFKTDIIWTFLLRNLKESTLANVQFLDSEKSYFSKYLGKKYLDQCVL